MIVADATILVVDDDPDVLQAVSRVLSLVAPRVLTTSDGSEALAILAREPIDAVLSDIAMPTLDGITLLARIRSQGLDVPVVFLSGMNDRSYVLAALRLDAFDFLEKPFEFDELMRVMGIAAAAGRDLRLLRRELEELSAVSELSPAQITALRETRRALLRARQDRLRLAEGRIPQRLVSG